MGRLEMHGSGLKGPIPLSISSLQGLIELRISDINNTNQPFPMLDNMAGLTRLVLRNCNISGVIPPYVWSFNKLRVLDLSFNKLTGQLPATISTNSLKFIFLSGNLFSGNVPNSMLKKETNVDLSYNNLTWQSPEDPACQGGQNLNLYRSFSMESNNSGILPCIKKDQCPQYGHSLYINCGGEDYDHIDADGRNIKYLGDSTVLGGAATLFLRDKANWGLSSTGDFMDDNDFQNIRYTTTLPSLSISVLYTTARLSPLSLTYYHRCLENGNYSVTLHFAEIQFRDYQTYSSLGRRIFDIYIQDNLEEKDFNIENKANGVLKEFKKKYNASVTNNMLEIRFSWASKGTTRIPRRGVYGPLISAISVDPNFKPRSEGGKKRTAPIVIGVLASCFIVLALLALFVLRWRGYLFWSTKTGREKG
ncbi:unnamed protein product [Ilex paraguariensis]|uniref:non-specific serine/threonine protein kinase n=1 Tax=Ilex paraguariensis TaxID=185542 RepID=A0ABC8RSW4_9AQUA